MSLYELTAVSRIFRQGGGQATALRDLDLRFEVGEIVAIKGPSGSGKSTLIHILGAIDKPSSGTIRYKETVLTHRSQSSLTRLRQTEIGFVFQQFHLIPTLTAAQQVEAALIPSDLSRRDRRQRTKEVIEMVGLAHRAEHLPGQLSGGEMQRVGVARALANRPTVLLADEPTGNLDTPTGTKIVDLLISAVDDLHTLILVTHDDKVADRARRIIELEDGRVVSDSGGRR
jgi:putative ABC transport system ATP-binding protein